MDAAINLARYQARLEGDLAALEAEIAVFLGRSTCPVVRRTDEAERELDLRPLVSDLRLLPDGRGKGSTQVDMWLAVGQRGTARTDEVLGAAFGLDRREVATVPVHRVGLFIERDGLRVTPLDVV